jgi:hypothetical protein
MANGITSNCYLNIINNDIDNSTTNLSILSGGIYINCVDNITLSILTNTIDDQFTTTNYIDDKAQERCEYADQDMEPAPAICTMSQKIMDFCVKCKAEI